MGVFLADHIRQGTPDRASPIPFASSADSSILPIVTSQRDRFRQRNAELEEELRRQFQTLSELRAEIKNLQADNLKLYEKVRYMQSYREDAKRGGGGRLTLTGAPNGDTDDMSQYRQQYEASMNPFQVFRGRVGRS
jgi:homeobox protein cut-like